MARLIPSLPDRFPMPPGMTRAMFDDVRLAPNLRPLARDVVGDIGNMLWVLMGTVGIVFLVACANIANLFLVRAEGRQQELAVRAALGANRWQVVGALFTEALTISVGAGLVGLALAEGGIRLLRAFNPTRLPRLDEIAIDPMVLFFVLLASLAAGLLFGLLPVLRQASPHLALALREGGRGSSDGRERHRARNSLVVAQVALALVLLVASGLMVRTFLAMRDVPPGFTNPGEVLTMRIAIPEAVVEDRLVALRRTGAAGGSKPCRCHRSGVVPLTLDGNNATTPSGPRTSRCRRARSAAALQVDRAASFAVGNTLVAGRDLTWDDIHARRPVVLVSASLAREFWGSPEAAIGRRVRNMPSNPWREVVGVVGDERDDGLTRPAPAIVYWPMAMDRFWDQEVFVSRWMSYAIRTPRVHGSGFVREVQEAVWAVNPNLPVARVRTLQALHDEAMAETEFALVILAIAAAVTLLLGLVGLYGVIAYTVAQRRREVGIRMALGAAAGAVQGMFIRHGLQLAAVGLVVGVLAALGVTRLMSALLFGVAPSIR